MADWFQVPAVSTATNKDVRGRERAMLYNFVRCCQLFAAEHASLAV